MTIIGRAFVELHGITDQLEKDINKALTPGIKKLANDVGKDISSSITKSVQDGFKNVKADDLELDVDGIGELAAKKIIKSLNDNLKETIKVRIEFDEDHIIAELDVVMDYVRERVNSEKFQIKGVGFSAEDWEVKPSVDQSELSRVRHQLDDLKDDYEKIVAQIKADYDTVSGMVARAHLQALTRMRFVDIVPKINQPALMAVEAALAFSGMRLARTVLDNVWDLVKNLDKSIPKITLFANLIAYLAGLALAGASNILSLAYSLGTLAALAAPIPGILGGMVVGLGATIAVFTDFKDVAPQVLGSLSMLQNSMSSSFWSVAIGPLNTLVYTLLPEFSAGIVRTAAALGGNFGSFFNDLTSTLSGQLTPMFANLNRSINIAAGYTKEYSNIILVLGKHGSEYLPRLARWFGEISLTFSNWLTKVEESGQLQEWVDTAIVNLGYLGDSIKGAVRILYGLASAAEAAGGSSLRTLADALNNVADVVNSEPFKSRLTSVFASAHKMMKVVAEESGPAVKQFFADLAGVISRTLVTLAPAIGDTLNAVATALSNPVFRVGFFQFVEGIGTGLSTLSSAFIPLGTALGSLGGILGNMATQFAPILSNILTALSDVIVDLAPAINVLVTVLSTLLEGFTSLPAPIVAGTVALIAMRSGISGLVPHFSLFLKLLGEFGLMQTMGLYAQTLKLQLMALGTAAKNAAIQLLRFATSPVGLTILAIGAALGIVVSSFIQAGNAARDSAVRVQELADTLDAASGAVTENTRAWMVNRAESEGWLEASEKMGVSSATFVDALLGVPSAISTVNTAIDNHRQSLLNAHGEYAQYNEVAQDLTINTLGELSNAIGGTNSELEEAQTVAERTARASGELDEAQQKQAEAWDVVTTAVNSQISSLETLVGLQMKAAGIHISESEALISLEESYASAAEAIKKIEDPINITTAAGRENRGALNDVAKAAIDAARAMFENGRTTDEVTSQVQRARGQFLSLADQMGLSAEDANNLANELGLIDGEYVASIMADTSKALFNLNDMLLEVNKAEGTVSINGNPTSFDAKLADVLGLTADAEGMVTINGDPVPAQMTVSQFIAQAGVERYVVPVDADIEPTQTSIQTFFNERSRIPDLVKIDGETDGLVSDIEAATAQINQNAPSLPVQADTTAVMPAVTAVAGQVAATTAAMSIDANGEPAASRRNELVASVNGATATMKILADGSQAAARRQELLASVNAASATMKILADGRQASTRRQELITAANAAVGTMRILADGSQAANRRQELIASANAAAGTMKIYANADPAYSSVNTLVASINRRTATVTVYTKNVATSANGNIFSSFANGGTIEKFASGGMRRTERHVAQIAQAGAMRLWAEPETGGEAYIPLAKSKRSRSLQILEEVARRMGLMVIPQLKRFAGGGVLEMATRPGTNLISSLNSPPGESGQAPRVVYNQYIYYPVADKVSTTTNRGLQFAARIGE